MGYLIWPLEWFFGVLRRIWRVSVQLRFNLLAVVLGIVFLVVVDQGKEIGDSAKAGGPHLLFLVLAMVIWIFQSFYSARYLVLKNMQDIAPTRFEKWLIREAPWVLVAGSIGVVGQFLSSMFGFPEILTEYVLGYQNSLQADGIAFDISTRFMNLMDLFTEKPLVNWLADTFLAFGALKLIRMSDKNEAVARGLLRQKGPLHRTLSMVIPILLAFSAVYLPVETGFVLGAGAIVFLTLSILSSLGTWIDIQNRKTTIPLVLLLFVVAVFCSVRTSNHGIRIANYDPLNENPVARALKFADRSKALIPDHDYGPDESRRSTLKEAYLDWLMAQDPVSEGPNDMVIVATAGGGIRATYWTATVLGALEDASDHDFSKRLFAVSGVSGGGVGGVIHNASLKEKGKCNIAMPGVEACSQDALKKDFLGPTAVAMFYPDFLQRFLPVPVLPDRAGALERAWEAAWGETFAKTGDKNRLGQPFLELWEEQDKRKEWVPILFLNSLHEQTGKRIVTSNIKMNVAIDDRGTPDIEDDDIYPFFDVIDFYTNRFPCAIPASTAAHSTARFTFVSPVGDMSSCRKLLLKQGGDVKDANFPIANPGHLMDGGYFENYGAATALEVLRSLEYLTSQDAEYIVRGTRYEGDMEAVQDIKERHDRGLEIRVVQITNEPSASRDFYNPVPGSDTDKDPPIGAHQTLGPVYGVLNSRVSRGILAAKQLRHWIEGVNRGEASGKISGEFSLFRLDDGKLWGEERKTTGGEFVEWSEPPLGWTLSRHTQVLLCQQLRLGDNREEFENIADQLDYEPGTLDHGQLCMDRIFGVDKQLSN